MSNTNPSRARTADVEAVLGIGAERCVGPARLLRVVLLLAAAVAVIGGAGWAGTEPP